jgi:hypothetical protein
MELSAKAIRFVIEALDHFEKYHDERLRSVELSADEAADLENDRLFLKAILAEFEKHRTESGKRRLVDQSH